MTRTTLAIAADYADAMMVARRAKNWLFLVLLLVLLAQLSLFFLARYAKGTMQGLSPAAPVPAALVDSTQTAEGLTAPVPHKGRPWALLIEYTINVTDFLGMTLVMVLGVVLLLLVTIMLVGRLVGVSHVTSAFVWCVVLAVLLFPWQALLNRSPIADAPDFKIPGVLYTWPELRDNYDFHTDRLAESILKWARFVGWPVVSVIILLAIQVRSNRGLRLALGEADVPVDTSIPLQ